MIEVRQLRVRYRAHLQDRTVLHVPALDLDAGQVLGVVGESGAGKSQLALALIGLVQAAGGTVEGSIRLDGVELAGAGERQWRRVRGRRIAMIMQSPRAALNPTLTLGTLFARTLALHGVTRTERRQRMNRAVREVDLAQELLDRYPHQVSGGQAQRFAIALVTALRADVLLADEPTSALDVTVQAEVMDLLRGLRERHGTAVLFISHDLAVVGELADHVLVLRRGEVVEHGPAARVLGDPEHPYTRELLAAVPVIGARP